jgi:hypothetical protein
LRWVRIEKLKDQYATQYTECFDDGDYDFVDIYDFSPLHPDEPLKVDTFELIEDALNFVVESYKADLQRFVSAGIIQEEYKDYLKARP